MRPPFRDFLTDNIVVFDGAMGTELYNKGVFINRCFDQLNLSSPDLVKGVITEFAHVSVSGWDFGIGPLRLGAGGEHAIVNIALKVTEVESGRRSPTPI